MCYEWHMKSQMSGWAGAATQVATGALAAAILIVALVPGNDLPRALVGYVGGSILGGLIARNRAIVVILPIVVLAAVLAYVQTGCSDCGGGNEPLPKTYTFVASAAALVVMGGLAALGVLFGQRFEALVAERGIGRMSGLFRTPVSLLLPVALLAGGVAALGVRQHRSSKSLGALVGSTAAGTRIYSGPKWTETPSQGMDTSEIAAFSEFPLYWLGTEYHGLNLRVALSSPGSVMLIYGACGPAPCTAPLSLSLMPACKVQPAQVATAWATETLASGAVLVRFRDPGHLMLWSGGASVSIQTSGLPEGTASVVAELVRTSETHAGLSAPDFAACS